MNDVHLSPCTSQTPTGAVSPGRAEGQKQVTIELMDVQEKSWSRVNYDKPQPIDRVRWDPRP